MSELRERMRSLERSSQATREVATLLSERVRRFEQWIAKLPGRIECTVTIETQYSSEMDVVGERMLSLERRGKEWVLEVFSHDADHPLGHDSCLLRDASVHDKVNAVRAFPRLLEAMAIRHEKLQESVKLASAEFDRLASELGIREGA